MTQLPLSDSDPSHNNHALFSDYYLNQILPRQDGWLTLLKAATPLWQTLKEWRKQYTPTPNEAQTERDWVRPILDALGHSYEVQVALKTPDGTKVPDYVFFSNEAARHAAKGKVLTDATAEAGDLYAVGDAKAWERPLDVALKTGKGDPFSNRNPGYQIAFYMQHSAARWGILTNGRQWRLYHKESAHKLERYYEVDLPALLAQDDPEPFLYFYAFFHRSAFSDHPLSVDAILAEGRELARGVGESLKSQSYTALELMAQGFLAYRRNALTPDSDTLKQIYDNALIVLYRLLFILYAEARDLLPVRESEDYRRHYSLNAIKQEIAGALTRGAVLSADSTTLWTRLTDLWHFINVGNPPLKIATFNGGLFDPARHPFLEANRVGDRHLQLAIEQLARVAGEFVDYRDLEIRHLGTIYEGLLEYHLEPVSDPEAAYSIALVNEKGERKATGSYYTPDYVVHYIVETTVGAALREAVAGLDEERAKVEAVLNLNVLDPAMGSGHFLVEATEQIARFLVDLDVATDATPEEGEITYWKRRVAQACIYGVDLNPLAVDLAKLSLWLTTVAKDKPLSFLDHHLRAGNSLVGTLRLDEMRGLPPIVAKGKGKRKSAPADPEAQPRLFESDDSFRRSMSLAVDSMWLIEGTRGETIDEVKQQEQVYARLRAELTRRYQRAAHLLTARDMGAELPTDRWQALLDVALARSGFRLPLLDEILDRTADAAARDGYFHWSLEFPELFFDKQGNPLGDGAGFDVVLGNPPYVRQETLAPYKGYFAQRYADVSSGTADLFVYFFARGMELLKAGGRLSYISSNSWLRANYAAPLRAYLRAQTTIETLVDLGDNRVFADAPDVYPAIHLVRRAAPPPDHTALAATFTRGEGLANFKRRVAEKLTPVAMHDQSDKGWQLDDSQRAILHKLQARGTPLGEVVKGEIYYGIKTGFNEAFIIDRATRDRLIAEDAKSAEIIKPILGGLDLRPWYQAARENFIIVFSAGSTRALIGQRAEEKSAWQEIQKQYPALASHLLPYAEQARKRQDKGDYWWELRPCDYYAQFEQPKILWPDITKLPRFSWDESGYYLGNTGYILVTTHRWLLAWLMSRCAWFLIAQSAQSLGERAGLTRYRLIDQYMRPLPVPNVPPASAERLAALAEDLTRLARARHELHHRAWRTLTTTLGQGAKGLNNKLTAWWTLDAAEFLDVAQKHFRLALKVGERGEWIEWLDDQQARHHDFTVHMIVLEQELNRIVYALYDLSPADIEFIERSTKYGYGEV